jgi:uncharacterized protein YjbI with pentapeptide repeats
MANDEDLARLRQGAAVWNAWAQNLERRADLSGANLIEADLRGAVLCEANLREAALNEARLHAANLHGANLREAILYGAALTRTDLTDADLTGCRVHGISAWDLKLEGAKQRDLVITFWPGQPEITVDNLEVAQFIYLLLSNEKIRSVIDTITSKVVLILGRFTPERKAVLDALREELRKRDYLPVLFDFDKPASRDITETVSLLARMARFVIGTSRKRGASRKSSWSLRPTFPSVPIQPLLQEGAGDHPLAEVSDQLLGGVSITPLMPIQLDQLSLCITSTDILAQLGMYPFCILADLLTLLVSLAHCPNIRSEVRDIFHFLRKCLDTNKSLINSPMTVEGTLICFVPLK